MIFVRLLFWEAASSKGFPSTVELKAGVFKFLCLKSVFGKLRFRDGFIVVCTVGLAVAVKLRIAADAAFRVDKD